MFKSHTNGPITHGVKKPRGTKVTNKRKEESTGRIGRYGKNTLKCTLYTCMEMPLCNLVPFSVKKIVQDNNKNSINEEHKY